MNTNDFSRLTSEYDVVEDTRNGDKCILIHDKHQASYPYRVKRLGSGFRLEQAFSVRSTIPPKFHKLRDTPDVSAIISFIVRRHNVAAREWMASAGWKEIK